VVQFGAQAIVSSPTSSPPAARGSPRWRDDNEPDGAALLEQNDEWLLQRHHMQIEG
jgi:hypothetical protein